MTLDARGLRTAAGCTGHAARGIHHRLSHLELRWTPEEVAEWREVPNAFITAALSEGVVLYEQ